VVPIVSGLPAFFIRGAPPSNVGFFFDGVEIPLLYHAFFGPSVVHPGFIDSIEFYPGSSPRSTAASQVRSWPCERVRCNADPPGKQTFA